MAEGHCPLCKACFIHSTPHFYQTFTDGRDHTTITSADTASGSTTGSRLYLANFLQNT